MYKGKKVSLVLPAYNEEEAIGEVVTDFYKTGVIDEIVVVDNNSTDKTAYFAKKTGKCRVVKEKKQGYGHALQKGMASAKGDIIVTCDADKTYIPKEIKKLLSQSSKYDFVWATRVHKKYLLEGSNMDFARRFANRAISMLITILFRGPLLTDLGCTFRLLNKKPYETIKPKLKTGGGHFQPELTMQVLHNGFSLTEVPVTYGPRAGVSKISGTFKSGVKTGYKMAKLILKTRYELWMQNDGLKNLLPLFLIVLVGVLSTHKSLGFYFWHDDFSVHYVSRAGECLFGWPYLSYCSIFPVLDKFINYDAYGYFLVGLALWPSTCLAFYYFVSRIFDKTHALLLSLIFSTAFMGAGAFFENYNSITSFLSLTALFYALKLYVESMRGKTFDKKLLLGSLVAFLVSIVALRARSSTYSLLFVGAAIILPTKIKLVERIKVSLFFVFFHVFVYFLPLLYGSAVTGSSVKSYSWILSVNLMDKAKYFLQNIGSFLVSDKLELYLWEKRLFDQSEIETLFLVVGAVLMSLFLYLIKRDSNPKTRRLKMFSLIMVIALYLPYGLLSDWRLGSNHRYLIFVFPAVLLLLGNYLNYKIVKIFCAFLVIVGVVQTNAIFEQHRKDSILRSNFYKQLHQLKPELEENAVLFFEFPQEKEILLKANDFFRVGHDPSEAALGTEYKIDYQSLKIITTKQEYDEYLNSVSEDQKNIFRFYYDGQTLTSAPL